MPRIQIDLPAKDLQTIEEQTGDPVWPTSEAAIRYMVADWLEMQAQTPEYIDWVKVKLAEAVADPGQARDMDEVFDELEARLAGLTSKAS